jgi:para-aminobenzoate synthetase component 1
LTTGLTDQPPIARHMVEGPWREPLDVAAAFAEEPGCVVLLSDGSANGRWSYVLRRPTLLRSVDVHDPLRALRAMLGERDERLPDGPPFQGGLVGIAAYDLGGRLEPAMPQARSHWPGLMVGLYRGVLAFDHRARRVIAIGHDACPVAAGHRVEEMIAGFAPGPLAETLDEIGTAGDYAAAVGDVVARIAAGEIFQANIARRPSRPICACPAALWSPIRRSAFFRSTRVETFAPTRSRARGPGRRTPPRTPPWRRRCSPASRTGRKT